MARVEAARRAAPPVVLGPLGPLAGVRGASWRACWRACGGEVEGICAVGDDGMGAVGDDGMGAVGDDGMGAVGGEGMGAVGGTDARPR
jgi:hypothetical protein